MVPEYTERETVWIVRRLQEVGEMLLYLVSGMIFEIKNSYKEALSIFLPYETIF